MVCRPWRGPSSKEATPITHTPLLPAAQAPAAPNAPRPRKQPPPPHARPRRRTPALTHPAVARAVSLQAEGIYCGLPVVGSPLPRLPQLHAGVGDVVVRHQTALYEILHHSTHGHLRLGVK